MLRPRRRKVRRKSPVVQAVGLTGEELAAKAGVELRSIRYYIAQRLLPAARFRGASTRYEPEHLVRLLMVKKLKAENLTLREIRTRMALMSYAEIEAAVAPMLGAPTKANVQPPAAEGTLTTAETRTAETWRRLVILPGVELFVQSNVSPHARRVVSEIQAMFEPVA